MFIIILIIAILLVFIVAVSSFMRSAPFGLLSADERVKRSPHYREGRFRNLRHTPNIAEGANYARVMWDFLFAKEPGNTPGHILPSKKTDLADIDPAKDILVWFGHSSYFMQADGKKILVDPVFSGNASPLSFTTKSYKGSDVYTAADMPVIDYLFITHDHWDHLDYATVTELLPKVKHVITGLGTESHLERWGYDRQRISETDWYEELVLDDGFTVRALPARHFSGRGFKRDQSLWMSFALKTPTQHIYIGGDSGYDTHFAEIGEKYGPFDLAILECGQYNLYWKYIHMLPEEVITAAKELRAAKVLPVHWAKFSLGIHAWNDPIDRVTAEGAKQNLPVLHPMIGEEVELKKEQAFERWWEE